jgi:HTH-type transcriptional repressor of NAD biosynthesis genes
VTIGRSAIVGTFMPPHTGHRYVVDFARGWGAAPLLIIFTSDDDPVDASLRLAWLAELFPDLEVCQVHTASPLGEDERANAARPHVEGRCDTLFGSDESDLTMAGELGWRFVPVDPQRLTVPAAGTAIRDNTLGHWEFLLPCVRSHFAQRICIFGPSGSGKTSLAEQLAVHYDTAAAYDYRSVFAQVLGRKPGLAELTELAIGQNAAEDAMASEANQIMFCDSNAMAAVLESRLKPKDITDELRQLVGREYALTLLMDVDGDWAMGSGQKPTDKLRRSFEHYRQHLIETEQRYLRLDGNYDTRFRIACDAVDNMTGQPTGRPPRPEYLLGA